MGVGMEPGGPLVSDHPSGFLGWGASLSPLLLLIFKDRVPEVSPWATPLLTVHSPPRPAQGSHHFQRCPRPGTPTPALHCLPLGVPGAPLTELITPNPAPSPRGNRYRPRISGPGLHPNPTAAHFRAGSTFTTSSPTALVPTTSLGQCHSPRGAPSRRLLPVPTLLCPGALARALPPP